MEQNEIVTDTNEVERGPRGELGQATAGLTMKNRWHAWVHANKLDPNKRDYLSLKQYARLQMKSGDDGVAKAWFAHKHGALNQKRNEANFKAAYEARTATRTAKRKSKRAEGGAK